MTYIACVFQPNEIVVAADTRANYFNDIVDSSRKVVGKRIRYFWDGNRKVFMLRKSNHFVACQGLLFWGNNRHTLTKLFLDFKERVLGNALLSTQEISFSLHKYFIDLKRDGSSPYETMHFIVGGFENGTPKGFYVNTFYAEANGVQELPLQENTGMYINGDGKAHYIDALPEKELKEFVVQEVMKQHRQKPFDIGDEVEVLEINAVEANWFMESKNMILFETYDSLMNAIEDGSVPIRKDGCPADLMLT